MVWTDDFVVKATGGSLLSDWLRFSVGRVNTDALLFVTLLVGRAAVQLILTALGVFDGTAPVVSILHLTTSGVFRTRRNLVRARKLDHGISLGAGL